jgi:hypothetical protein
VNLNLSANSTGDTSAYKSNFMNSVKDSKIVLTIGLLESLICHNYVNSQEILIVLLDQVNLHAK